MAVNYASKLPQDQNNAPMNGVSTPFPAGANTYRDNASTSSVIGLGANTTLIEVTATGTAAIRWSNQSNLTATSSVITTAGSSAFDNVIPANTTRTFVVPRATQGISSVVGRNAQEGLYSGVATKTFGIASVIVTEY